MPFKSDHTTWCRDALGEVNLLRAYLEGLKQHLIDEKERFRSEIETVVYDDPEPHLCSVVRFFRGLDDETWALEDLFTQHFPNLLMRSALVSFYTFAEVTLGKLCDHFTRYLELSVSVADMKDKGIHRAKRYLTKICGLNFGKLQQWPELKNIAKIRNLIAHADGRVSANTGNEIRQYIDKCAHLRLDGEEVIISLDYLDHFLDVIEDVIEELGKQIQT